MLARINRTELIRERSAMHNNLDNPNGAGAGAAAANVGVNVEGFDDDSRGRLLSKAAGSTDGAAGSGSRPGQMGPSKPAGSTDGAAARGTKAVSISEPSGSIGGGGANGITHIDVVKLIHVSQVGILHSK